MADETCFVFKAKRRGGANESFVRDHEQTRSLDRRISLYSRLWERLETSINANIDAANLQTLDKIEEFALSASSANLGGRIPSVLIVTGPSASAHFFDQFQSRFVVASDVVYTPITPTEASNLKSAIRSLISKSIQSRDVKNREDDDLKPPNGPKLLNYDLEILHSWCQSHGVRKILIDLQNSEAFDVAVLTDFLLVLHAWNDRLPVVLLFGIATSVEDFQERLPTGAIKCLRGESFNVAKTDETIEQVFETAVIKGDVHLGSSFTSLILQRAVDNVQNAENFIQTIKYAYMCHFYGNPTSIFLDSSLKAEEVFPDTFEAVRNFSSFRSFAEQLLEYGEAERVQNLLQSNEALLEAIFAQLQKMDDTVAWMMGALRIFHTLSRLLDSDPPTSLSSLYVKCLTGNFTSSSAFGDVLMAVKSLSSDKLTDALTLVYDTLMTMPASDNQISPDDFGDVQDDLTQLLTAQDSSNVPLQAYAMVPSASNRGSAVQSKQNAGRQRSKQLESQKAYAELLTRFHGLLQTYFGSCLVPLKNRFPYEIAFYDTKALHHNALTPKPRFAIERALSSPHDYLGCSCCVQATDGLMQNKPYTSILYHLYVESGALINVFDLWSAFSEIVSRQHHDEKLVMALFFRAVATLRYLGMLKPTRRRVDHVGKTMWKGL